MMKWSRSIVGWAIYDWANSAFATTVMAGFFPIFFKQYWCQDVASTTSTFRLGLANSMASLIVAAFSPLLGAMADRGGAKKQFLIFFASMGIVMTGGLFFVTKGAWEVAVLLYVFAIFGFSWGNISYDSLLVSVVSSDKRDMVSALGFGLGYLGGGLLFSFNVFMTLYPSFFFLDHTAQAVRLSFISVAIWWGVFSIPVMLWVKEPSVSHHKPPLWILVPAALSQLRSTFDEIRKLRYVFIFLIAYWLYIDGVDTIVRMAVDYGMSLGFNTDSLIVALLITQFVGFPAAIGFGRLGERIGTKRGILVGIVVYLGVTIWAVFMERTAEFFALAITIGLVQGGVQALSRSFYSRLIPSDKAAEFYGFYNMLGKFASVIGPFLMGWVGVLTGNPRIAIMAIIILFLGGATILFFVDEKKGILLAHEMENK
jgi:UMF1 family MFS transporter